MAECRVACNTRRCSRHRHLNLVQQLRISPKTKGAKSRKPDSRRAVAPCRMESAAYRVTKVRPVALLRRVNGTLVLEGEHGSLFESPIQGRAMQSEQSVRDSRIPMGKSRQRCRPIT